MLSSVQTIVLVVGVLGSWYASQKNNDNVSRSTSSYPANVAAPERFGFPCNVDVVDGNELDEETFRRKYYKKKPVLIVNNTHNRKFHETYTPEHVVNVMGDLTITANSGYRAARFELRKQVRLKDYYESTFLINKEERAHRDSLDYAFGGIRDDVVERIQYVPHPTLEALQERNRVDPTIPNGQLFIAFGPEGTGIPFHQHFDAYAEQCSGLKRWHMFKENGANVHYTNLASHGRWMDLHEQEGKVGNEGTSTLYTCTQGQGEIMYTPGGWRHATYSLDPGFAFVWQSWGGADPGEYETMYTDMGFSLHNPNADADAFEVAKKKYPESSAMLSIYAQFLRSRNRFKAFYEVADESLALNSDNVHLLLVYLHASVETGNLEKGKFALHRLRELQKEYGLGVHDAASRDIYSAIDALEGHMRKGVPVSRSRLPEIRQHTAT